MLALLRTSSVLPTRSWALAASSRCLSTTVPRLNETEPAEPEGETDAQPDAKPAEQAKSTNVFDDGFTIKKGEDPRYVLFLNGPGKTFRVADPQRPRNWLGGNESPFPLNPSFRPPTPVSDRLRNLIWDKYMEDPDTNSVRNLAALYGLSIKRVDAILRLKGLEQYWMKKKPLQLEFVKGMEAILGVQADAKKHRLGAREGAELLGENTTMADADYDEYGNDKARHRYQRMFWEPHAEDAKPVVPSILEKARAAVQVNKAARAVHKSDPVLLGDKHLPEEAFSQEPVVPGEVVSIREGRPDVKFVDVGGKYIDVKDRKRRIAESERRSRLREKRRAKRLAEIVALRSGTSGQSITH